MVPTGMYMAIMLAKRMHHFFSFLPLEHKPISNKSGCVSISCLLDLFCLHPLRTDEEVFDRMDVRFRYIWYGNGGALLHQARVYLSRMALLMPARHYEYLSIRPGVHQSGKAVMYEFVLPGSMRPVTTIALPSDAMAPGDGASHGASA